MVVKFSATLIFMKGTKKIEYDSSALGDMIIRERSNKVKGNGHPTLQWKGVYIEELKNERSREFCII